MQDNVYIEADGLMTHSNADGRGGCWKVAVGMGWCDD